MLVAKWAGVWVPEFGIGFPPRILRLFKWQETEFTLNWLPLGGFARMEGESFVDEQSSEAADEEDKRTPEEKEEARKHSLYTQPPGKRVLIYLAGPVTNLLIGWILAILLFLTGIPIADEVRVVFSEIAPNSPAAAAGLQAGDTVLAMNGQDVVMFDDVTRSIQAHLEQPLTITVEREGEEHTVSLTPRENPPPGEGAIGVMLSGEALSSHIELYPVPQAVWNGTQIFAALVAQTVWMPVDLLRGLIPIQEARPIGIVNISRIAYQSIQQSAATGTLFPILNLLIVVSVGLGIFNLLPIPALDEERSPRCCRNART
jgi:regulator of sigma E protease